MVHLGWWGAAEAGGPETERGGREIGGREYEEKERGGGRVGDPAPMALVLLGPGRDGKTRGVEDVVVPWVVGVPEPYVS